MLIFLTGFIASIAHVVTGPDHLAAVTPLAIDSRKKSWVIGFSWGLGHTLGMLLIGLLFILFKELLPVDLISRQSDKVIGILLIVIGGWAIIRIYLKHSHGNRAHIHFHTKPFLYAHIHRHSHDKSPSHEHEHTGPIKQTALTALFIGVIHGFAGFNHLFVLLPSLALPTVWDSVIYITAFASGTILTMILFAFILGLVAFRSAVKDKQLFLKWFTFSGGLLAIAIGVLWLIHPI
ncbi:MAG: sulfite exporter TauE/SafE family protein [Bacteroidales bacterium]|jgi:ABC-type nickel/cobalt efflux system permease component RcnA